jgi:hypothetical protein
MANIYVDPAATGEEDGSSWANAFIKLQDAVTAATNLDHLFCKGTELPTSQINLGGKILYYIGCNASGDEDGTHYVIDGTNYTTPPNNLGIIYNGGTGGVFRNFHVKNSVRCGISSLTSTLFNCLIEKCDYFGLTANGSGAQTHNAIFCTFLDCKKGGLSNDASGRFVFYTETLRCGETSTSNALQLLGMMYGSIVAKCTGRGVQTGGLSSIVGSVIDGNSSHAILVNNTVLNLFGVRITNNGGYAVDQLTSTVMFEDYNLCLNNSSGCFNQQGTAKIYPQGHTLTSGVEGYVDRDNNNYNLTSVATLRDIPMQLDGDNVFSFTAGLIPASEINVMKSKSKHFRPCGAWRP